MQTLVLINPVVAPPRPEDPSSDSITTEAVTGGFADLVEGVADGSPSEDQLEPVPVPVVFVVTPENGLSFRLEPMGAVQGLAEAAVMPKDAPETDLPGAEIPAMDLPLQFGLSTDPLQNTVEPTGHPTDLAPAAGMGIILRPQMPQDFAHPSAGPEIQMSASRSLSDRQPAATSASNLLLLPVVADGSLPMAQIFWNNLSDGFAAETAGPVKSSTLAINMQPPPSVKIPADTASQHIDETDSADAGSVESALVSSIAKLVAPSSQTPAPPAVNGAALLWQADPMAGMDQSESAEPTAGTGLVPAATHVRDPSAVYFRVMGQVAQTLRWGDSLVAPSPVLDQSDDPGLEMEAGALPVSIALPTSTGILAGIRHPSTSVGLEDLPRLAAQLAETLVHRTDGQTQVALSPEELGHVRLTMQADAQNPDRMVVMLSFERPETLDLFRRHADQLADALKEAGYSGADISFGRSGGEGSGDGADPDRHAPVQQDAAPLDRAISSLHQPTRIATTGSLDLRL